MTRELGRVTFLQVRRPYRGRIGQNRSPTARVPSSALSPRPVRSHLQSVYGKLQESNRRKLQQDAQPTGLDRGRRSLLYHSQNVVTEAMEFIAALRHTFFIGDASAPTEIEDDRATVRLVGNAFMILPGFKLRVTGPASAPTDPVHAGG